MAASRPPHGEDQALYVISVVAELAGIHPQTLRMYERKGLLDPKRTSGNSRRYSDRDIELLTHIQELTDLGVNLAGVKLILGLEEKLQETRAKLEKTQERLAEAMQDLANRRWQASRRGMLVRLSDVPEMLEQQAKQEKRG
ncbi:MAG: heat shock protein transcriptional repressor HspR [Actinomycetota bacterium]